MLTLEKLVLVQDDFRLTADLSIPAGSLTALIGPSGAGKSTLLAAIAGFFPPASGRILWNGADLGPLPPGARPLSILFQDQNLFPHLTVAQNLGLGLRPDLRLSLAQQAQVQTALGRVGLTGLGARKPGALSGGQQSRVALARTLLRARPLLLLDEPFAALGPALKAGMLDLVRDIAAENGTTVIMVSHDPADAHRIAPLTVVVAEGRAHPPADTAGLFAAPPPALAAYLGK
jgi:thiamine transport system ATP-binding protein